MRRGSLSWVGCCGLLALALVACGGQAAGAGIAHTVPTAGHAQHLAGRYPPIRLPRARAAPMTQTPARVLASCKTMRLIRHACPRSVPQGRFAQVNLSNVCENRHGAGVPIRSPACVYASWEFVAGAPAGLPPDAPPGLSGKRLGPRGTRPPGFVHVVIYASRRPLANMVSWAWPQGQPVPVSDGLLYRKRSRPVQFGWVQWAGHRGQLVLAPSEPGGGMLADHLIDRFSVGGVNYAVTLHSWAPLAAAIVTLHAVVASTR
ncbi:MAG: hypothetical protein ACRDMX_15670 [Solirubrobacteraceae bacterium]